MTLHGGTLYDFLCEKTLVVCFLTIKTQGVLACFCYHFLAKPTLFECDHQREK